jgi:hypothetical protein
VAERREALMIKCLQCGREFALGLDGDCVASISGSVMGDEVTHSYYPCDRCGTYTIETYYEPFFGDGESNQEGPIPREAGDAAVAVIKACPQPWDKQCRCEAHLAHFKGALD